jgi:hypothetical protein
LGKEELTPARTLVKSKTLIPESGNRGSSIAAFVEKHRPFCMWTLPTLLERRGRNVCSMVTDYGSTAIDGGTSGGSKRVICDT